MSQGLPLSACRTQCAEPRSSGETGGTRSHEGHEGVRGRAGAHTEGGRDDGKYTRGVLRSLASLGMTILFPALPLIEWVS